MVGTRGYVELKIRHLQAYLEEVSLKFHCGETRIF